MLNWGAGGHLGDALFSLSYLMRCAGNHSLFVLPEYVDSLSHLAAGSRVTVRSAHELPANAEDTWMANGRHEAAHNLYFRNDIDIIGFVHTYFNHFGKAWEDRSQMLFDFPWLKKHSDKQFILFLNTSPMSGQCPGYSQEEMNRLALDLTLDHYHVVKVVDDNGGHSFSLTQIAVLSSMASMIIGGASGPFFVTMNTSAADVPRIVLLDPMRLDYGPNVGPIYNVKSATEAREVLKSMGFFRYQ